LDEVNRDLLPPLEPQLATYHIVFITPYVLIDASKKDWIEFLRRNMVVFLPFSLAYDVTARNSSGDDLRTGR
jgi:hypothetical protein